MEGGVEVEVEVVDCGLKRNVVCFKDALCTCCSIVHPTAHHPHLDVHQPQLQESVASSSLFRINGSIHSDIDRLYLVVMTELYPSVCMEIRA